MDAITRNHLNNLQSKDAALRYESFQFIINLTNHPVDWAYDVWDDLIVMIKKGDNHQRTIAVQLLSNLAKSDSENRMQHDLDKLMVVTKDEKFVTARHSLLALWKIAVVNKSLQQMVIDRLAKRYKECITEKNCTLVRYDIMCVLRKIYDHVHNDPVKTLALSLIETEKDSKYQKKYTGVWKDTTRGK
ncbi:MAG: hypothetical protein ABI861_01845 [Panacibacter sp.]